MAATAEARGPCKRLERSPEIGMALVAAPAAALFFFPVRQLRPRWAPAQTNSRPRPLTHLARRLDRPGSLRAITSSPKRPARNRALTALPRTLPSPIPARP